MDKKLEWLHASHGASSGRIPPGAPTLGGAPGDSTIENPYCAAFGTSEP